MSTETITVVSLDAESSRDGTKHWWILTDALGRKLKVWEPPVADALRSLAASGPVEVDVRASSDPKYYPSVTAARPTREVSAAAMPSSFPQPPVMNESRADTVEGILADFMRDFSDAARRVEARLRDLAVPF